jgi:hypothetical protein
MSQSRPAPFDPIVCLPHIAFDTVHYHRRMLGIRIAYSGIIGLDLTRTAFHPLGIGMIRRIVFVGDASSQRFGEVAHF